MKVLAELDKSKGAFTVSPNCYFPWNLAAFMMSAAPAVQKRL